MLSVRFCNAKINIKMIRKAELKDIEKIVEITGLCASKMIDNGIFQWNDIYPSRDVLEEDIALNQLFVFEQKEKILGCIVISEMKDDVYKKVKWLSDDKKHYYIHRLAVHPKYQGKGYAQKLMDFAESKAKDKGIYSIRLDTFSQNPRNQKFYEQRGYHRLDEIYFPRQSKFPFYCYELVI